MPSGSKKLYYGCLGNSDAVAPFTFLDSPAGDESQPAIHKNLKRLFKILVEEVGLFLYTDRGLMSRYHRYFKNI